MVMTQNVLLFEKPEVFPMPDLTAALLDISSPFTNPNAPITPANIVRPENQQPQHRSQRPPLLSSGALAFSSGLFPEIATSQIQTNIVFLLFAQRHPHLFSEVGFGPHVPRAIQQKMLCTQSFEFVRKVCFNYLPQMNEIFLRITVAHTEIPPNAIPPEVGYALIGFIDFFTDLSRRLPDLEQMHRLDVKVYKCVVYQAIGDETRAVMMARKLLEMTRTNIAEVQNITVTRIIIPAFVACACLLQYGHLSEAGDSFDLVDVYADCFLPAVQAITVLRGLRASFLPAGEETPHLPSDEPKSAKRRHPEAEVTRGRVPRSPQDPPRPSTESSQEKATASAHTSSLLSSAEFLQSVFFPPTVTVPWDPEVGTTSSFITAFDEENPEDRNPNIFDI